MNAIWKIMMASTTLMSTVPAAAECITRMQEAANVPVIADFLDRMGSVESLPGVWEGKGHSIEFHVREDRIESRFDSSDVASVRVCTTNKSTELRIETLNEAGAITDTSKIKLKDDGSIGIQNKRAPFGIWVGFKRTSTFPVPRSVVAALAPRGEVRTALALPRGAAVSN